MIRAKLTKEEAEQNIRPHFKGIRTEFTKEEAEQKMCPHFKCKCFTTDCMMWYWTVYNRQYKGTKVVKNKEGGYNDVDYWEDVESKGICSL